MLQCVDAFNIEQIVEMRDRKYVLDNLETLIQENDHVSLFMFPYADKLQLNIWNRVGNKRESFLGDFREFLSIALDAVFLSSVISFFTALNLLPRVVNFLMIFKINTRFVLKSYKAFNRSIYHLHNELEFAVARDKGLETIYKMEEIYKNLYSKNRIPFMLLEVRFTPGHNNSLISPGQGRDSVYIDQICNQSTGYKLFYSNVEEYIRQIDARPHMGKYCKSFNKEDFTRLYGKDFSTFKKLIEVHDPDGKFQNRFVTKRFF